MEEGRNKMEGKGPWKTEDAEIYGMYHRYSLRDWPGIRH